LVLDATRGDARFLVQIADIRRPEESAFIQAAHKALRLATTSAIAHLRVANVVTADGHMRDALIHLRLAVQLQQLGYVEAQAGHVEAAEAILKQLTATPPTEYVARSWLGAIQLALGRLDRAATELRRAYAEGDWELGWAPSDPRWDPVRGKIAGFWPAERRSTLGAD
jgi:tetratricopeptide (TPR) repeat protein